MATTPTLRTVSSSGRDINTTTSKTTNRTVPSGTADGNVLYAFVAYGNATNVAVAPAQTGWIQITAPFGGSSGWVAVYRRIWHTGDPTTFGMTITRDTTSTIYSNWSLVCVSGADTTSPEDTAVVMGTHSASAATNTTLGTVNVSSTSGVLLLGFWGGISEGGGTYSAGSDGTATLDVADQYVRLFSKQQTSNTVGTNAGSMQVQSTSAQGAATQYVMLAIRPVGAQQSVFAPTSVTAAPTPYVGGQHMISPTTGKLMPVRPRDIFARPTTSYLRGPNVLSRCKHNTNTYVVNQLTTRRQHVGLTDASDIELVYGNVSGIEVPGASNMTVTAAVELPSSGGSSQGDGSGAQTNSQIYPVTFGGQLSVTISSGQYVKSDPLPIRIRQGRTYFTRTFVTVPSGGTIVAGSAPDSSRYEYTDNTTTTDQTLSGTISGSVSYGYSPVAIIGTPYSRAAVPMVVLLGDSIMQGVARNPVYSWAEEVLELALIPHLSLAMSGEQAVQFGGQQGLINEDNGHRYRGRFIAGATDVISDYSINDFSTGATAAQMQTRSLGMSRLATQVGARFHQTTITPKTTSTDSWATANNHAWLRDGAPVQTPTLVNVTDLGTAGTTGASSGVVRVGQISPTGVSHPFTGIIDTCAAIATTNASSQEVWHPNAISPDGLHPGSSGHNMIAAAFATYVSSHFTAIV
jgi:hypothetical protein